VRLLFALPGFHKYDRGAEVALLSIAGELSRTDDEVTVMGSGRQREGSPYNFRQVASIGRERFERFPHFPPLRTETAWEDASFAAALLRAYEPSAYDAVITCSFPFTHWALRRPAAKKPLQIFVTQNGDWPAINNRSEYRTFVCDGLVCTNPDYFERNHQRWTCALIPNGVDLNRFHPGEEERARLGLPNEGPVVLMVSAFIASKRVLDGIRAVARLDGATLVVAGNGPLRDEARALADKLLPGRFRRVELAPQDMPALYRSADAFLHLSLLESFGNVFLEAWASGLPIVAHDTPRLRWILAAASDYLCDTEKDHEIDDALRRALRMGRRREGRVEGVERFAWSAVARQYRNFIDHLLQAQGKASRQAVDL
jgi:glycosyltransferase involved in cell wall biosynthesis